MNKLGKILFAAGLLMSSLQTVNAVPAYPGKISFKQKNGTTITVFLRGDEWAHQTISQDGYPLVMNDATGNYEFAAVRQGALVASGFVAADPAQRSAATKQYLKTFDLDAANAIINKRFTEARAEVMAKRQSVMKVSGGHIHNTMSQSDIPTTGKQKSLVMLIQFQDTKFSMDDPGKFYNNRLNKSGYTDQYGSPGSARDYFIESSDSLYEPDFVVIGPVTVSHNAEYYGANSNGGHDNYSRIANMIHEACLAVNDTVNFRDFDTDNDGVIDNVSVIFAGHGEADGGGANTIWPHASNLLYYSWYLDNKLMGHYMCSNELIGGYNIPNGNGTFIHEFSHVLGLMDHYDITYGSASSYTPAAWDVMASGCYNNNGFTPCLHSAFERATLGWLNPKELAVNTDTTVTLQNLNGSNFAYSVTKPKDNNEFFLLENRQRKGFDAYLPHHGMLVWHIDYDYSAWSTNQVNVDADHQRVDLVEADGSHPAGSGASFPGTTNAKEFSFSTFDDSELFSFADVQERNGVIFFHLGGAGLNVVAPANLTVTEVGGKTAKATWDKVQNAEAYRVVLYAGSDSTVYKNITDTSLVLTDLTPSTDYTVKVSSTWKSYVSPASTATFTTTALQFSDLAVTANEATDVSDKGFTASWTALDGADNYLLNVYTRSLTGSASDSYGFDANADDMPATWSTESSTYNSTVFGEAAPSLRLTPLKQYFTIEAPEGGQVSHVSFWYKIPRSNCALLVQKRSTADGEWVNCDTVVTDADAHTYEITLDDAEAVRFFCSGKNTYFYIDDVKADYLTPVNTPVAGWTNYNVGKSLSFAVTGLTASTEYAYAVTAVKGTEKSAESNLVVFTTLNSAQRIDMVGTQANGATEAYDLQGRRVDLTTAPSGLYIVKRNGKTIKMMKR